jgi:hypothetical protein
MLAKGKATAAIRIARTHPELRDVLAGRGKVVVAAPHLSERGGKEGERIVVGIYDYERDRSLVALVDVTDEAVVGIEETPAAFQLDEEERATAEDIARQDDRARRFLRRRRMNPLTRLYFPPNGSEHRHAIVFLRPNTTERRYAVVDLTDRVVVDLLEPDDLTSTRKAE